MKWLKENKKMIILVSFILISPCILQIIESIISFLFYLGINIGSFIRVVYFYLKNIVIC